MKTYPVTSFYTAFRTAEEYRLLADGRPIGTLPIEYPIVPGSLMIFAGRRWKVLDIDVQGKTVELTPSSGGRPPKFSGAGPAVHETVRRRMFRLYCGENQPGYLDAMALRLLAEGRREFIRQGLDKSALVHTDGHTHVVSWAGDRVLDTLATVLTIRGLEASHEAMTLTVRADPETVAVHLRDLATQPAPDAIGLAEQVANKAVDKWDELLDDALLSAAYAARDLDVVGAWNELTRLVDRL